VGWTAQKSREHRKSRRKIMPKFNGTYDELKIQVQATGIPGSWRDRMNFKQYRADIGAVLNWWPSTGTISFQGPAAEALEVAFYAARFKTEEDTESLDALRRENAELRRQLVGTLLQIKQRIDVVLKIMDPDGSHQEAQTLRPSR
jgi:hypothetical protein